MREGLYGLAASREMSLTIPSFPTQRILPGFTFAVEFTWMFLCMKRNQTTGKSSEFHLVQTTVNKVYLLNRSAADTKHSFQ